MAIIFTINTHPGKVPIIFPFFYNKKYPLHFCFNCSNFKPNRTHHCSKCNICVLNLDHHCTWLDTCIGFYNRKYFLFTLIYATIMGAICMILLLVENYNYYYNNPLKFYGVWVYIVIIFIMETCLLYFLHTHLQMASENQTTIDLLGKSNDYKMYNINIGHNLRQIFGGSIWGWFFPFFDNINNQQHQNGIDWEININEVEFEKTMEIQDIKNLLKFNSKVELNYNELTDY